MWGIFSLEKGCEEILERHAIMLYLRIVLPPLEITGRLASAPAWPKPWVVEHSGVFYSLILYYIKNLVLWHFWAGNLVLQKRLKLLSHIRSHRFDQFRPPKRPIPGVFWLSEQIYRRAIDCCLMERPLTGATRSTATNVISTSIFSAASICMLGSRCPYTSRVMDGLAWPSILDPMMTRISWLSMKNEAVCPLSLKPSNNYIPYFIQQLMKLNRQHEGNISRIFNHPF